MTFDSDSAFDTLADSASASGMPTDSSRPPAHGQHSGSATGSHPGPDAGPVNHALPRLSRRDVLRMLAAAGAFAGHGGSIPDSRAAAPANGVIVPGVSVPYATGYGTDPNLVKLHEIGDLWPLIMSKPQRRAGDALCDVLLPADDLGPSATSLNVPAFIDEWVSAPYPKQMEDRPLILEGLDWLDAESTKRFNKPFADLDAASRETLCNLICDTRKAPAGLEKPAAFFSRFRSLSCIGYYSTQEGWKAIGFVGNVFTPTFDGPPPEVLKQLDVEQTVS